MKTFTVQVGFEGIEANSPMEAAQIAAKWLTDDDGGAELMVYQVKDEESKEKTLVDLHFGNVTVTT